jgi:3alpha(or 20beta)-hydroxysteroid dehydrogenase
MFDVNDKVIVITGAGKANGQGAAEARLLAGAGATVYITDLLDNEGQATAQGLGPRVHYAHLDVSSDDGWGTLVHEILRRHGRLDGLVNNAGVWSGTGILDTSIAEMRRVIEVNQIGVFLGMKAVGPSMCAVRRGVIVNVGSAASLRVGVYYWHNRMTAHAYTATKWAVHGMTKAAAMEFAPHNVRVNSIHPGPIETSMLGGDIADIAASVPMKRLGKPADIASAVLFLMSDACPYMTGAEIAIDGAATV